jgi:DNA repair protein RecN (Recombination protein N)
MLRALSIRDFVIVDRLELDFAPGFTVLTGETGAGKSILIDALALVVGERGDAIVVRKDAERAEIGAEFDPAARPAARRWLAENDLAGDDGACLLRRVIEASGRSRGYINGRPATLTQLREVGELLVDIHGQHEHQSVARAGAQRELLDAYGSLADAARQVGELYRAWRGRRETRIAFETGAAALSAERGELEWQVRELEALKIAAGEWQELTEQHARLAHAASLLEAAQIGIDALSEGESSSLARLNSVIAKL